MTYFRFTMTNLIDQIRHLTNYLRRNRRTGNTTAALLGMTANPKSILLLGESNHAKTFRDVYRNPVQIDTTCGSQFIKLVPDSTIAVLSQPLDIQLCNRTGPIIVDNQVLMSILDGVLVTVNQAELIILQQSLDTTNLRVRIAFLEAQLNQRAITWRKLYALALALMGKVEQYIPDVATIPFIGEAFSNLKTYLNDNQSA